MLNNSNNEHQQENSNTLSSELLTISDEVKFIKTEALAILGNTDALFNLGELYEKGIGVERNEEKAIECYKIATEQGHSQAAYKIAEILEKKIYNMFDNRVQNEIEGIEQKLLEVIDWYKKAMELGHPKAEGFMAFEQLFLGDIYYSGYYGVEQNNDKALELYNIVAEQGDYADANLFRHIANIYCEKGKISDAVKWYGRAAEKWDEKAEEMLKMLAKQGNKEAKSELHLLGEEQYEEGMSLYYHSIYGLDSITNEKYLNESKKWIIKSAKNGYEFAIKMIKNHPEAFGNIDL